MWSKQPRNVGLREGRCRAQDQLCAVDRFGNVGRYHRELDVVRTVMILHQDARAGGAMGCDLIRVAAPEPDRMSRQRKIARGRERAVPPA
ncbi:hypothetical protein ACVW04_003178 [Bradyrhizobium sp. LM2.3]